MPVQFQEVDGIVKAHSTAGKPPAEAVNLQLPDIRNPVGTILVPRFVPAGFQLARTVVIAERDVLLTYQAADSKSAGGSSMRLLWIRLTRRANLKVKNGFVEQVTMGQRKGLLIKGQWLAHRDNRIEWDPDTSTSLALEQDDWVVIVTGQEASRREKYWDRDRLVKVAQSLETF